MELCALGLPPTRNINLKTETKKLTPRFIGPYKITHRLNPVTFRLQLPASLRIHPVFHQSQLKPVFFSPLSPQVTAPPRSGIIDGLGPEERSWVPGRFILDPALIQDYRRRVSSAPGPSGAGPGGGGTVTRTGSHIELMLASSSGPFNFVTHVSKTLCSSERLFACLCACENADFLCWTGNLAHRAFSRWADALWAGTFPPTPPGTAAHHKALQSDLASPMLKYRFTSQNQCYQEQACSAVSNAGERDRQQEERSLIGKELDNWGSHEGETEGSNLSQCVCAPGV
ncbi:Transposon Tf2-8 polyprotein [Labeo rohita]|uniref:Transposon Tf2-8 polyprotein n=1 Tax=Labeo rohita TaxID=84645 RepID=A0ABQ8L911_LABRO|nr:Transposon Tf2-8 polyprotein [Labeo rohita]